MLQDFFSLRVVDLSRIVGRRGLKMTLCGATPITAAASHQCGATNVMMFEVSFTVVAVQVHRKYTDRVLPPLLKKIFSMSH